MTRRTEDFEEEFAAHLDHKVSDLIAEGWAPEAAQAEARRQFGNATAFRAACAATAQAETRRTFSQRISAMAHDVRHAARALQRQPGFAVTVVLALALGIGLTGGMISVIDSVLLQPLPYPAADRLVVVWSARPDANELTSQVSAADFYDIEARQLGTPGTRTFGYMSWPVTLTAVAEPERLEGALVTPDVFGTLGVNPESGTGFEGVDSAALDSSVVISSRLASRLGIAGPLRGRAIRLNGQMVTVLGVMPPTFVFPSPATDVWVPLVLSGDNRTNRSSRWLRVVARLPEHTTIDRAQAGAQSLAAVLAEDFPATNTGWTLRVSPLHEELVGSTRYSLIALAGAVLAMVFVTAANVYNLWLGQLHRRATTFQVQLALGAGRSHLVRQLACEAVALSAVGGVFGLAFGTGLVQVFQRWAPASIPRVADIQMTALGGAVSLSLALIVAIGMAVLPLLSRRWWSSLDAGVLRTRQFSQPGTRRQHVIVVAQTAMVTILLASAAVFGQAFVALVRTDLGIDPNGIVAMRLQWTRGQYTTPDAQRILLDQVLERVGSLGGVEQVAAISDLPINGNSVSLPVTIAGRLAPSGEEPQRAGLRIISANYLALVRTPLKHGRTFTLDDRATGEPVAIVNETFARHHWPGENALIQRVRVGEDQDWRRVVGVVSDVRHAGPTAEEGPAIYVPHTQKSEIWLTWTWLTVRQSRAAGDIVGDIRAAVRQVDPNLPVSQVSTLSDLASKAVALPRMNALVASTTAAITLLLATLGIAALLAQVMTQRRAEFALRMALGAPRATVALRPVQVSVALVTGGWLIGSASLLLLDGAVRSQVGPLPELNPWMWLGSGLILLVAAMLATIAPLRSVLALNPIEVLRRD